jgi:hypothetical protein
MNSSRLRTILLTALFAAPALALAHPGHDGDHEFVWDFDHFVSHPLASVMGFAVVAAAGWLAWRLFRAPKSSVADRVRDRRR